MTPSLYTIFAVLVVVWWIIQAVVRASAKSQEQKRLAELARKRREQPQATSQAPVAELFVARAAPVEAPHTNQLEELRRRREAQLEELRRRKQSKGRTAQVRATPTAPPARPTHAVPAARRPPVPLVRPVAPPPAPAARARPSRPQAPRPLVSPVTARPPLAPKAVPQDVVEVTHAILQPTESPSLRVTTRSAKRHRAALPMDTSSLRRAIVLKEILDPPVALREWA